MEDQTTTQPSMPKHAELIASPVRRIVYPGLYQGYQPQLFTDLQKDAAIANELERLTRQIVFLQEDNARLHSDNTTLVDTLDEREKQLTAAQNSIAERDHTIMNQEATRRLKDAEIATLTGNVELLNGKVAGLEKTVQDKTAWINRLKLDQDALTLQLREKDAENGRLTQEVSNTHAWNAKLTGDVANLTQLVKDRDVENNRMAGVVEQYKCAQDQLMSDNSELSKMVDTRNQEIEVLNATIAQHVATIDTCNANIAQLQKTLNTLTAQCASLQAQCDDLTQRLQNRVVEIEGLNHDKALLDQRIAALTQENQGLKADKVGLETTLQTKNATIDDLGINLNNSNLDRQRFAMVASERTAQVNTMATYNPLTVGNVGYGMGVNPMLASNYVANNVVANNLALSNRFVNPMLGSTMLAPPSPNSFLARSLVGKPL